MAIEFMKFVKLVEFKGLRLRHGTTHGITDSVTKDTRNY